MANRLTSAFLMTVLAGSFLIAACGDDDPTNQGDGGEPGVSGSPGEAGSGGSGVSGSSVGGQGAGGEQASAGAGAGADAGGAGAGGAAGGGGEPQVGGAGASGEGGAGGSPDPVVVYTCGTTTIVHKLCSAGASLNCPDGKDCSDCVLEQNTYRADFAECPACLAQYDESLQCGVDAFDAGNAADGMMCLDVDGAQLNDTCGAIQIEAINCLDYIAVNEMCPETWPLPE